MTTLQDILEHRERGTWRALHDRAIAICSDASQSAGKEFRPVLGGGTRLMLAMNHRISNDIDLFITDPQWIGYISPRLNDAFIGSVRAYEENATSLKLGFDEGEIDFVVRMSLTGDSNQQDDSVGFAMESCSEVLAKKLFYRGWALTPRDLFDWVSIERLLPLEIDRAKFGRLLSSKSELLENALKSLPESSGAAIQWAAIKAPHIPELRETARWAQEQLVEYLEAGSAEKPLARTDVRPAPQGGS